MLLLSITDKDCTLNSQCSDYNAYCDQQGGTQTCRCPSNQRYNVTTGKCSTGENHQQIHVILFQKVSSCLSLWACGNVVNEGITSFFLTVRGRGILLLL